MTYSKFFCALCLAMMTTSLAFGQSTPKEARHEFNLEELKEILDLNEEQYTQIKELHEEIRPERAEMMRKRKVIREEKKALKSDRESMRKEGQKLREQSRELHEGMKSQRDKVEGRMAEILSAEQMTSWTEYKSKKRNEIMSERAENKIAQLAEKEDLSDKQVKDLRAILSSHNSKLTELHRTKTAETATRRQMAELMKETDSKVKTVLTAKQYESWKEMTPIRKRMRRR